MAPWVWPDPDSGALDPFEYTYYNIFRSVLTARWPSGLRRQNQDLVRKGAGSNPVLVKLLSFFGGELDCRSELPWFPSDLLCRMGPDRRVRDDVSGVKRDEVGVKLCLVGSPTRDLLGFRAWHGVKGMAGESRPVPGH